MTIFDSPRIYSLLEQYNPWWKNGQVSEKLPTMHREAYHDTLRTICSAELRRFAVLSGARHVGKTTVMKQLIVELLSRGGRPVIFSTSLLIILFSSFVASTGSFRPTRNTYPTRAPISSFSMRCNTLNPGRSGLRPCTICTRTCDWWRPVLQVRLLKRVRLTAA